MDALQVEVAHNYDWFQRNISVLLHDHAGQYALIKSKNVVGYFGGPGEAYRAGLARFDDRVFSVQQVTDEPVELGLLSVAIG